MKPSRLRRSNMYLSERTPAHVYMEWRKTHQGLDYDYKIGIGAWALYLGDLGLIKTDVGARLANTEWLFDVSETQKHIDAYLSLDWKVQSLYMAEAARQRYLYDNDEKYFRTCFPLQYQDQSWFMYFVRYHNLKNTVIRVLLVGLWASILWSVTHGNEILAFFRR